MAKVPAVREGGSEQLREELFHALQARWELPRRCYND